MKLFELKSVIIIIVFFIYLIPFDIYAIKDDYNGYFVGDYTTLWSKNQQDEVFHLKFEKNSTNSLQISKIYFWVYKVPNKREGDIQLCLNINERIYLSDFKLIVFTDGVRYEPAKTLDDLPSCIGWYPIKNKKAKVELVIEQIGKIDRPFPNISLTDVILRDVNLSNGEDFLSPALSADENTEVISEFMEGAGSTINITGGKNLTFIISLSKNKKLRLLKGNYQTCEKPIELKKLDNISIEGVPEATITGNNKDVAFFCLYGNKINISNLFFKDSVGGIFLENCSNFNMFNNEINSFGEQIGVSMKNSNNISLNNICIESNDNNSIGVLLDNSNNCKIYNNRIRVKDALFYLQGNSKSNTINDRNSGNIFDNGENISESDGTFSNKTIKNQAILLSNAGNTWKRGELYIC